MWKVKLVLTTAFFGLLSLVACTPVDDYSYDRYRYGSSSSTFDRNPSRYELYQRELRLEEIRREINELESLRYLSGRDQLRLRELEEELDDLRDGNRFRYDDNREFRRYRYNDFGPWYRHSW